MASLQKRKEPEINDPCISLLGLLYQHSMSQAGWLKFISHCCRVKSKIKVSAGSVSSDQSLWIADGHCLIGRERTLV